jgi:oxygen-independent coproporphyrinogen-3 oxidase
LSLGIYIHIPFCQQKCTYCNFNTTDFQGALASAYVPAVAREISYWGNKLEDPAAEPASPSFAIDSIYLGGGTPSIIDEDLIGVLIDACRASFRVLDDAEITIEINPGSMSKQKMETWRRAGVNRASVGIQSFIDRELVSLSRTHSAADAHRTVDALRESGFDNISLDLIAGLPEQTLRDWEFNLEQALSLRPEHLSLYLLEVKDGTQLYSQIKRGLRPSPDDDLAAEMYTMMHQATTTSGYEHYEISNFAKQFASPRFVVPAFVVPAASGVPSGGLFFGDQQKPPETKTTTMRSVHNMKYWTGAAYYGMGCGAHSYDGRSRWINIKKTESYIHAVASTGRGVAETSVLSDDERAAEALFMGLRLAEGIDLAAFQANYGLDVQDRHASELARLNDAGLIQIASGRLSLTDRGMLLSNEVFVSFV